jgi:hypothetical protein
MLPLAAKPESVEARLSGEKKSLLNKAKRYSPNRGLGAT